MKTSELLVQYVRTCEEAEKEPEQRCVDALMHDVLMDAFVDA